MPPAPFERAVDDAIASGAIDRSLPFVRRETVKALRSPALLERFAVEGVDPVGDTPEHFATYIREEIITWGKVVKSTGMQAD